MKPLKRLNWKVAAGGALVGVSIGGLAVADTNGSSIPQVNDVQLEPTAPVAAMPNGPLASPNSEIVVTEIPVPAVPAQVVLAPVVLPVADVLAPVDTSGTVSVDSVSVDSVDDVSVASVDDVSVDSVDD